MNMGDLRDIESILPPGFRFYPNDEELVCHYLQKKVMCNNNVSREGTMVEVDLHNCEPWELPDVAKLSAEEWYFFSFRDRKYATGSRANRATKCGYWKATGKDRPIYNTKTRGIVGMRKTLVFYTGRAPNGIKTNWIMHEFRLETLLHSPLPPKEDWVLCRVFHKNKLGDHHDKISNENIVCSSSSSYSTINYSPLPPLNHDCSSMQLVGICYNNKQISAAASYGNSINYVPQQEGNNTFNLTNDQEFANLRSNDDYGMLLDVELELEDNGLVESGAMENLASMEF